MHAVFGRLLAHQFDEMWRVLGSPREVELLEPGPGRGLFARDVLDWSAKKFPDFFQALHYTLVERSAALRQGLETRLRAYFASGKVSLADFGKTGTHRALAPDVPMIVFANEFFDALPVEVLSQDGALRVDAESGRFVEKWVPASAAELEFLDRYGVHPEPGDRTEVCVESQQQMSFLANMIQRGFFIAIDYGYSREEQIARRHSDGNDLPSAHRQSQSV